MKLFSNFQIKSSRIIMYVCTVTTMYIWDRRADQLTMYKRCHALQPNVHVRSGSQVCIEVPKIG